MTDVPLAAPTNQGLTAEIVAAYVRRNQVTTDQLSTLISTVHQALSRLGSAPSEPAVLRTPAVSVRRSVTPDFVVCLDCGWKGKILKRHIAGHGLGLDEYRARWNLSREHPLTAPSYSERRSTMAMQFGLGRGRGIATSVAPPTPKRRGRPRAIEAPTA